MIVPDLLKYLSGYLTIKVEGLNLEKFLNMSVAHGVNFWDINRLSITEIELKISIKGYRLLKKILKKTGCQITITSKDGLPFFVSKLKKRKMMALGFIVSILLVFVLSSFIWSIKVIGAKSISTKVLEENLSELGVKPGALKLDLSVSEIENNMLIKMKNLSWIKVKLIGTRAEIEIKERVDTPKIIPDNKPCNIVAKRDGIIEKIVSTKGDVLAAKGGLVSKGDILVTGIIDRTNIEKRYVHAAAEVKARTWYEGSAAVPFEKIQKVRTGNKVVNISLIIGSKILEIKKTSIPYKSYDKIEKSTKLIDTDLFQLPVDIKLEEYYETLNKVISLTPEEAKAEAVDTVEKAIVNNLPYDTKIINKNISVSIKENVVLVNARFETVEDIGVQEEIKN